MGHVAKIFVRFLPGLCPVGSCPTTLAMDLVDRFGSVWCIQCFESVVSCRVRGSHVFALESGCDKLKEAAVLLHSCPGCLEACNFTALT